MTDKQNFEKDINVPSKRLDRIDKMEIDLANYEQMERDIEKIIEPYQLDWELDCLSLPSAIQSILERKEQECEELRFPMPDTNYVILTKEEFEQLDQLKAENDKLKTYITSFDYLDALSNEQVAVLYTACIDELAIRGYEAKYKTEASLLTRYHNALTEIKFWARELLKRTGQVVPYEIKQILQKISECEAGNDNA